MKKPVIKRVLRISSNKLYWKHALMPFVGKGGDPFVSFAMSGFPRNVPVEYHQTSLTAKKPWSATLLSLILSKWRQASHRWWTDNTLKMRCMTCSICSAICDLPYFTCKYFAFCPFCRYRKMAEICEFMQSQPGTLMIATWDKVSPGQVAMVKAQMFKLRRRKMVRSSVRLFLPVVADTTCFRGLMIYRTEGDHRKRDVQRICASLRFDPHLLAMSRANFEPLFSILKETRSAYSKKKELTMTMTTQEPAKVVLNSSEDEEFEGETDEDEELEGEEEEMEEGESDEEFDEDNDFDIDEEIEEGE